MKLCRLLILLLVSNAIYAQVDTVRQFKLASEMISKADTVNGDLTFDDLRKDIPFPYELFYVDCGYSRNSLMRYLVVDPRTGRADKWANGLCKPGKSDSIRRYVFFEEGKISWAIILYPSGNIREQRVFTGGDTTILYQYYPSGKIQTIWIHRNASVNYYMRDWYENGVMRQFHWYTADCHTTIHMMWHANGRLEDVSYCRNGKDIDKFWSDKGVRQIYDYTKGTKHVRIEMHRHRSQKGRWEDWEYTRRRSFRHAKPRHVRGLDTTIRFFDDGKFRPMIKFDYYNHQHWDFW